MCVAMMRADSLASRHDISILCLIWTINPWLKMGVSLKYRSFVVTGGSVLPLSLIPIEIKSVMGSRMHPSFSYDACNTWLFIPHQ